MGIYSSRIMGSPNGPEPTYLWERQMGRSVGPTSTCDSAMRYGTCEITPHHCRNTFPLHELPILLSRMLNFNSCDLNFISIYWITKGAFFTIFFVESNKFMTRMISFQLCKRVLNSWRPITFQTHNWKWIIIHNIRANP